MSKKPGCFGEYRSPQHDAECGCYTCVDDDDCAIQHRQKMLAERASNAEKDLIAAQGADDVTAKNYLEAWRASHPEMYAAWLKNKEGGRRRD